mmetsp:Transcript_33935/g.95481  ORF Transcript_33935/g.95481 Transcript_33935/m.95481 type:complete len:219 (-) Transcript_33935:528-1184(-)
MLARPATSSRKSTCPSWFTSKSSKSRCETSVFFTLRSSRDSTLSNWWNDTYVSPPDCVLNVSSMCRSSSSPKLTSPSMSRRFLRTCRTLPAMHAKAATRKRRLALRRRSRPCISVSGSSLGMARSATQACSSTSAAFSRLVLSGCMRDRISDLADEEMEAHTGSPKSYCPLTIWYCFMRMVFPVNGGTPLSRMYRMTPRLHMSPSLPNWRSRSTSGAM